MRGGKDYDSDFATRMKGSGLWSDLVRQRFVKACRRLGFNRERVELDLSRFRPPGAAGQGNLFCSERIVQAVFYKEFSVAFDWKHSSDNVDWDALSHLYRIAPWARRNRRTSGRVLQQPVQVFCV
jgi:hypothetical protein